MMFLGILIHLFLNVSYINEFLLLSINSLCYQSTIYHTILFAGLQSPISLLPRTHKHIRGTASLESSVIGEGNDTVSSEEVFRWVASQENVLWSQ